MIMTPHSSLPYQDLLVVWGGGAMSHWGPPLHLGLQAANWLSPGSPGAGRHFHWQKGGGAVIVNGVNAAHLKNGVLPHQPTTTLVAA